MEYKLGNPAGTYLAIEKSDCVVRALTNASGVPYWQMHDLCEWLGRKPKHLTSGDIVFNALEILGIARAKPINRYMTLAKFVKAFPKGSFYVHSLHHAWAVKDGVVHDSWKVSGKARIRDIGVIV